MLLEVFDRNMNLINSCDFESSYYDNDMMLCMSKAGYSFKVDGRWLYQGVTETNCENQPDTMRDKKLCDMSVGESLSALSDRAKELGNDLASDVFETMKNSMSQEVLDSPVSEKHHTENQVQMIECVETGKRYAKQAHAARDLGIDPGAVSDSIKTGRPRKGYTFRKVWV